MLNAEKALAVILAETQTLDTEVVKLRKALHRILAQDIIAGENLPQFDNSAMDGYAIRSADTRRATFRKPAVLRIAGEASAGNVFKGVLNAGEAVRVMTGGKIPQGADAVAPLEIVETEGEAMVLRRSIKIGQHVRSAGEDVAKGETVLHAGEYLTPPNLGLLASLGCSRVEVRRRPVVAILATGDELVRISAPLKEGQIRNSNSYVLAGYVTVCGGKPNVLGIVEDDKKKLVKKLSKLLSCDMLLVTGGVSVGKYDYVKEALAEAGVEEKFWKVNIKPGKPLTFGKRKNTLVFGLPGNPASTSVTFLQFVKPALEKMLGRMLQPPLVTTALIDEPIFKDDGKRHYIRGVAYLRRGQIRVRKAGSQSSGVLSAVARANCLIVLPEKTTNVRKNSFVTIELI